MTKRGIDWGRANQKRRMSDRGVSNVTDEKEWFENDPAAQWLNRPQPAKPTLQQHRKPKSREQYKVINPVRSEAGSDNMIVQPEPADPNERPPWE